jgi:hypothetical protein
VVFAEKPINRDSQLSRFNILLFNQRLSRYSCECSPNCLRFPLVEDAIKRVQSFSVLGPMGFWRNGDDGKDGLGGSGGGGVLGPREFSVRPEKIDSDLYFVGFAKPFWTDEPKEWIADVDCPD